MKNPALSNCYGGALALGLLEGLASRLRAHAGGAEHQAGLWPDKHASGEIRRPTCPGIDAFSSSVLRDGVSLSHLTNQNIKVE